MRPSRRAAVLVIAGVVMSALHDSVLHAAVSGEVTAGYQQTDVTTAADGKVSERFERYGEHPEGVVLEDVDLLVTGEGGHASITASRVGRNDAAYGFSYLAPDKLRLTIGLKQTPHLYSNDARSLHALVGDDHMQVNLSFAQRDWSVYSSTELPALLERALPVRVDSRLTQAELDLEYKYMAGGTFYVGASQQQLKGRSPLSMAFTSASTELAIPLDEVTDQAYAQIDFASEFAAY
ncbi:MAG: MtrB/PioB family outer membrane beta-barrel protein, partial [Elusimicrobiota bacterium]